MSKSHSLLKQSDMNLQKEFDNVCCSIMQENVTIADKFCSYEYFICSVQVLVYCVLYLNSYKICICSKNTYIRTKAYFTVTKHDTLNANTNRNYSILYIISTN